jgi:hypothetical protein
MPYPLLSVYVRRVDENESEGFADSQVVGDGAVRLEGEDHLAAAEQPVSLIPQDADAPQGGRESISAGDRKIDGVRLIVACIVS